MLCAELIVNARMYMCVRVCVYVWLCSRVREPMYIYWVLPIVTLVLVSSLISRYMSCYVMLYDARSLDSF